LIQNNIENSGKFTFFNILSTHTSIEEETLNEIDKIITRNNEYKKKMFYFLIFSKKEKHKNNIWKKVPVEIIKLIFSFI